jgi:hypothetical protein
MDPMAFQAHPVVLKFEHMQIIAIRSIHAASDFGENPDFVAFADDVTYLNVEFGGICHHLWPEGEEFITALGRLIVVNELAGGMDHLLGSGYITFIAD